MKKIAGFCLVVALTVISGCKKEVDKLTEFDINYSSSVAVPAGSYAANVPTNFTTPQVPTQSASKFSAEKTAADHISEIKLSKFNISVSNGNLNALKSVSIYI